MSAAPAGGNLPTEAPLALTDPASAHWDGHCGLLVVGLGAAGAAAAIAAKEAGGDVCVADRFGYGGATALSGGVVYAGGGTRQQLAAGYADTPAAMFDYLRLEVGDSVSEATLKRFCEDSKAQLEWLESLGASFDSKGEPPKTSYPPDGTYLYFSGNEKIAPFAQAAPPAPRGHRTVDAGLSGAKLFNVLRARVDALKIPVLSQSSARRLITDAGTGAVLGVEIWQLEPGSEAARKHAKLIRRAERLHNVMPAAADRIRVKALALELRQARSLMIRTTRGVVLATGGFIFNRPMVAEHAPDFAGNMRLGATGCDGSGIRLGQSAGGDSVRLDKISAWRFIDPPGAWTPGIVVNQQGRRFCNEAAYGARLGVAMCEQQDGHAWLIIDARLRRAAIRECLFGRLWAFQRVPSLMQMLIAKRAGTVAGLADKLDMPVHHLCATVDGYNAAAEGQRADDLDKGREQMQPLRKPPFYALNISADNPSFPCPAITLGGLRVDETTGAVLNRERQPITGLYAAGRAAVGVASNSYVSGLSIADCLWSGRRAGAAAVSAEHESDAA